MKKFSYQLFIPGGNDTALVFGLENDLETRRAINSFIMKKFPNVEQVGFVSKNNLEPQLFMAGGEFCGNAARSAAWYYLNGMPGELNLKVSGVKKALRVGINTQHEAWAQMPVYKKLDNIIAIEEGFFWVEMEGITHIVVMPKQSTFYLTSGRELKKYAKDILSRFQLLNNPAAGVIFLENSFAGLKIHPCVYVSDLNTMYYETACGSGTIAVGLVMALIEKRNIDISLIQPSLKIIKAIVNCKGLMVIDALIMGEIITDNIIHWG